MENDHLLLQLAVLLPQITEISAGDVKDILHHTASGWVCKIKDARETFFIFFFFFLTKGIAKFASERN